VSEPLNVSTPVVLLYVAVMLVPLVSAASTSSPPATNPVVRLTVAPDRFVLSTSVIVTVASITFAPSSSV